MHFLKTFAFILIVLFQIKATVYALDLVEAYGKAKANDPEYLSVLYDYRASLTLPQQAASKVLPQVYYSYSISNYRFIQNRGIYSDYTAEQNTISLRQAIFDLPSIIEIKQADLRTKAAEARLRNAEQNLIRRLCEAYFDFLYSEQYVKVIREEKKAIEAQLNLAKKLFEAGEATLTDVHDAEARLYDVVFRETEAEKLYYSKKRNLGRIIGEEPTKISVLIDKLEPENIVPSEPEGWIEIAKSENPFLKIYKIQKEVAEDELRKQKAQWLPSLSLFSGYSRTNTRDFLEVKPLSYLTLGIQVNWNILSGGYITAKIKEATERLLQADKEYEKAFSDVSQGVVESFFGVKSSYSGILSSLSQVKAYELALDSTKKGYEAGIRTFVDILNAESALYRSKGNFVRSNHEYIKALINLYFYGGTLSEMHVSKINNWLKKVE